MPGAFEVLQNSKVFERFAKLRGVNGRMEHTLLLPKKPQWRPTMTSHQPTRQQECRAQLSELRVDERKVGRDVHHARRTNERALHGELEAEKALEVAGRAAAAGWRRASKVILAQFCVGRGHAWAEVGALLHP